MCDWLMLWPPVKTNGNQCVRIASKSQVPPFPFVSSVQDEWAAQHKRDKQDEFIFASHDKPDPQSMEIIKIHGELERKITGDIMRIQVAPWARLPWNVLSCLPTLAPQARLNILLLTSEVWMHQTSQEWVGKGTLGRGCPPCHLSLSFWFSRLRTTNHAGVTQCVWTSRNKGRCLKFWKLPSAMVMEKERHGHWRHARYQFEGRLFQTLCSLFFLKIKFQNHYHSWQATKFPSPFTRTARCTLSHLPLQTLNGKVNWGN